MKPSAMWIALVTALVLGACSKGVSEEDAKRAAEAAMKAAGEALPAELREKIKFQIYVEKKKGRFMAVVPAWPESEFIPGTFEPGKDAGYGFHSPSFRVSSNCDGTCEPKDWAAVSDKVDFSAVTRSGTIEKDEKLPGGGRLVVVDHGGSKRVVMAIWKEDSRRYFTCRASLPEDTGPAAAAFEQACRGLQIMSW